MMNDVVVIGKSGQLARCLHDIKSAEYRFLGRPEFDITNNTHIEELFRKHPPKLVINASAYTAVDKAETDEAEAYLVNSKSVKNLSIKCQENKTALIHISTDYVFDGKSKSSYKVADKTSPQSVYGASKLEGEKCIMQYIEKYVIIRTSWVFSRYGNNFVKTMLKLARNMDEISVVGDQLGSPTSAHNLARVVINIADKMLKNESVDFGVYHYTDAPVTTWHGFANEIFHIASDLGSNNIPKIKAISSAEYESKMQPGAKCAKRPENSALDVSLICKNFGINQRDWKGSLRDIVKDQIQTLK